MQAAGHAGVVPPCPPPPCDHPLANCVTLNCVTLNRVTLNRVTLNCVTLNCVTPNRVTLNCVTPNCVTLNCVTLAHPCRWTAVNRALAELQAQAAWAVPDAGLRYALRDALAEELLPLYQAFFDKYKTLPFTGGRVDGAGGC